MADRVTRNRTVKVWTPWQGPTGRGLSLQAPPADYHGADYSPDGPALRHSARHGPVEDGNGAPVGPGQRSGGA